MDGVPPLEEPETLFRAGGLGCIRPWSLFTNPTPAVPQCWMASPSSSTRIAQLSWNSSSVIYKEPGGKDMSHKNGAPSNRQANDIIPPPEQVHQHIFPEDWHPKMPAACWNGIRWWLQSTRRKNSTSYDLTWPSLRICASQLHQVCIEVLPHPRESGWHPNAVLRYCLHEFHHYQLSIGWQAMEVGIMMGCDVSPLLLIMCMELILWSTTDTTSGEEVRSWGVLPPRRAFMNDVTTLVQYKVCTQELLGHFHKLLTWAWMKVKPKKSRSISLVRGTICDTHYSIGGNIIPTVREQPVKSLGRLYAFPLTDRHRGVEVQRTALENFYAI